MAVRAHKELLPRTVITNLHHTPQPDPNMLEQLGKNITRMGITNSTLNYLRVSGDITYFTINISLSLMYNLISFEFWTNFVVLFLFFSILVAIF